MTTVDSAASATATPTASSTASTSAATSGVLADYDDFLNLLTAQLRNQDPLNPQDGSEFVEQIATFTGVEQQVNANTKLDQLVAALTGTGLTDMAEWVGKEVLADGLMIDYAGGEVQLTIPAGDGADAAAVVIKDMNGVELARIEGSPEGGPVIWDGAMTEGGLAPSGVYQVQFAYTTNTEDGPTVRIETPESGGRVVEARISEDGAMLLVMEGGLVVVDPEAVKAVGEPVETPPNTDEAPADDAAGDAAEASAAATDDGAEQNDSVVEEVAEAVEDAVETVEEIVDGTADAVADAVAG